MSGENPERDGTRIGGREIPLIEVDAHPRSSIDMVSGLDHIGDPIPAWAVVSNFAETSAKVRRGFSYAWTPINAPPGIYPGRTIVGEGRKNLVLGTLRTVASPAPFSTDQVKRVHTAATLPCGLFIGLCRSLVDRWTYIENSILDEWDISPKEGDWADQRPFYRQLRNEHLAKFEYRPALVWAVPYWVLTVNKRNKLDLGESCYLRVREADKTGPLYFGDAAAGSVDFAIPRRVLKRFRFQRPSGSEERDGDVVVVNRTRYRKNSVAFMVDNYYQHGLLEDEALTSRGFNRATADYYQEIDGWKLHGAWAILTAAFFGDKQRCYDVVYTHQVIDPFTQKSHDIGLIKMNYDDFWGMSYGLAEAVLHLAR